MLATFTVTRSSALRTTPVAGMVGLDAVTIKMY